MANKRTQISKSSIIDAQIMFGLCDKAKEIVWQGLFELSKTREFDYDCFFQRIGFVSETQSPIEQILFVASEVSIFLEFARCNYCVNIIPQCVIETEKNTYFVDFLYIFSTFYENNHGLKEEIVYELVVECDGHDFHQKTKKQVEHDNERELEIQMSGYDVVRFSGSQIYNNPFKCADDALSFGLKKFVEKIKQFHKDNGGA